MAARVQTPARGRNLKTVPSYVPNVGQNALIQERNSLYYCGPGIESQWGRDFPTVQTGPGGPPSLL